MKNLILCADDYALTEAISSGICCLAADGRLSAVSCMSESFLWKEAATALKPYANTLATGLHFNLTETLLAPRQALTRLIIGSLTYQINNDDISKKLHQQLDLFEEAWGKPPEFVDGHQHIHIFPGIRKAVMAVLAARYPGGNKPWLRQVSPDLTGHDAMLKAMTLRLLNIGFAGCAKRAGLSISGNFYGLYSLSVTRAFSSYMQQWLINAPTGSLIMCHPGGSADDHSDPLSQTRWQEFNYLASIEFKDLLSKNNITLDYAKAQKQRLSQIESMPSDCR